MLLKKLESFFLLLTFGFFLFSCTVEEKKVQEKPFVSTECDVSIEVLGTDSITYDRLVFEGTIDGNPIYIPDNLPKQDIKLGMGGTLEITVKAVDVNDFTLADGSAKKEITESTNIEIQLNPKTPSDDVYLTFVNELETLKLAYAKKEVVEYLAEPKKDGYTFEGWFTEPNGQGKQLQLGYEMVADITVYAFWIIVDPNTTYTVTFETNGGSAVSPSTVKVGETIAQPTDPTKADHTFVGWCSDSSLTKLVNFPYTVNANVTLYAKWVVAGNEVKVTGVKLDKPTATAKLNYAIQLTHFIEPTNATNKSVTWTSSNPSVASVSDGKVTGLSAGTATITVTTADGGFTATCTVTVSDDPIGKTLSYLTLAKAASSSETAPAFTVTAKYSDRTTEDVTSKATWKSSDSSVATVSSGIVTLVAAGSTDVTASHTVDGVTKESNKATLTVSAKGGNIDKLFFMPSKTWSEASPRYAAYFFKV
jgi:uncharacterized repeat protein (TIGR02543 family)